MDLHLPEKLKKEEGGGGGKPEGKRQKGDGREIVESEYVERRRWKYHLPP